MQLLFLCALLAATFALVIITMTTTTTKTTASFNATDTAISIDQTLSYGWVSEESAPLGHIWLHQPAEEALVDYETFHQEEVKIRCECNSAEMAEEPFMNQLFPDGILSVIRLTKVLRKPAAATLTITDLIDDNLTVDEPIWWDNATAQLYGELFFAVFISVFCIFTLASVWICYVFSLRPISWPALLISCLGLFSAYGCVAGFIVCERYYVHYVHSRWILVASVRLSVFLSALTLYLVHHFARRCYQASLLHKAIRNSTRMGHLLLERFQPPQCDIGGIFGRRHHFQLGNVAVMNDGTFVMRVHTIQRSNGEMLGVEHDRIVWARNITNYHGQNPNTVPLQWDYETEIRRYNENRIRESYYGYYHHNDEDNCHQRMPYPFLPNIGKAYSML